jgi:hypothetical protein
MLLIIYEKLVCELIFIDKVVASHRLIPLQRTFFRFFSYLLAGPLCFEIIVDYF